MASEAARFVACLGPAGGRRRAARRRAAAPPARRQVAAPRAPQWAVRRRPSATSLAQRLAPRHAITEGLLAAAMAAASALAASAAGAPPPRPRPHLRSLMARRRTKKLQRKLPFRKMYVSYQDFLSAFTSAIFINTSFETPRRFLED